MTADGIKKWRAALDRLYLDLDSFVTERGVALYDDKGDNAHPILGYDISPRVDAPQWDAICDDIAKWGEHRLYCIY